MKETFPKTRAFMWKKDRLLLLDQRLLPQTVVWKTCRTWQEVATGIQTMVVRGAPAIGCVAAYGMALAALKKSSDSRRDLQRAYQGLLAARPTAVNLRWAIDRMLKANDAKRDLLKEAICIEQEDRQANRRIGELGSELLPKNSVVLTYCNTGSLATAGLGTAFGILWTAHQQGKIQRVIASETRPYLQGARLTAWELKQEKIPFELITDNMAAQMMNSEKVDAVVVGADRIAANGDTANKIGTYSLAVLAAYHHVPFYVAAPCSTIDIKTESGRHIPIEQRSADEVTWIRDRRIAPERIAVRHPAFDVTPAALITAIITERGVAKPVDTGSLKHLFESVPLAA